MFPASVTKTISLNPYSISSKKVNYQLSATELHECVVNNKQGVETKTGA